MELDPIQDVIDALRDANEAIQWVKPVHLSLEDLFMKTVDKGHKDEVFEPLTFELVKKEKK